jgi:NitT/TauT family transport system substrate-binding protein
MRKHMTRRTAGTAAAAAVILALSSACGSSSGGSGGGHADANAKQVSVLPAGVSLAGKPGTPAAKPLPKEESLKVGIPSKLELEAPALLAQAKGEFKKENLKVTFVTDTVPNLLTLLGQDKIDFTYAGAQALVFNALRSNVPIRWVSGVASQAPDSGLYMSKKFGSSMADFNPADLKGKTIGVNPGGLAAPSEYGLYATIKKGGLKPSDVKLKVFSDIGAMVQALEKGQLDGATFGPPFTASLKDGVAFEAAPGYPKDIQIAGYFATTKLLEQRRDVGVAFFRALERTINTYFAGNYHQNADVVKQVAGLLGSTPDKLSVAPAPPFDLNVPEGTPAALQEMYGSVPGTLQFKKPVTAKELIDLSLVIDAAQGK